MNKPLFIHSCSFDPWLNLALENYYLRQQDFAPILLCYVNTPCIVIGRFQNPWMEVAVDQLESTPLIRRQSGGGSVYHDEQNLNYCFIHGGKDFYKEANIKIIQKTLDSYEVQITSGKRGDLYVDTDKGLKKISGSAFKQIKNRSFHHGTMLVGANLQRLKTLLNPSWCYKEINFDTRAVRSIPHSVVNLQDLNRQLTTKSLMKQLEQCFRDCYGEAQSIMYDDRQLMQMESIVQYRDFLRSDEWCWQETPRFIVSDKEGHRSIRVERAQVLEASLKADQWMVGRRFKPFW